MNAARKYEYTNFVDAGYDGTYYDDLAIRLKNNAQEEAEKRYKKQNVQSARKRILTSGVIIMLFFLGIMPAAFIVFRNAAIHEAQNEIYRINLAIKDYETKTNEIKERLESNTSLDDLELYAREQVSMIKASSSKVIILHDVESQVKMPELKFSIAKLSQDRQKW